MTTIKSFVERLKKIGIEVELHGNIPWIYLYKVNGHRVHERFLANHGFTAYWRPVNGNPDCISDISKVFTKIREVLKNNGELPQPEEDYE